MNKRNPECPQCKRKTMIPHRQGSINPNPRSKTTAIRVCLDCYMDSVYAKYGVEA